jgi:hypothetical protein
MMSKRTEDLAFKYNINARTDELSLFVSEIYGDGVKAGVEKEANAALRDYFAASAMQGLLSSLNREESCDRFAAVAYHMANAMLKAREAMLKAREVNDE